MTHTATKQLSAESWESARGYAGVMGEIPSSFTVVVRALMNDHASGAKEPSAASRYGILRLLKSPSVFAPLYFAANLLSEHSGGQSQASISESDLIKRFTPHELAALIGIVYYFRRAQSLCPPEEFKYLADCLSENATVGLLLGQAIPGIGMGNALTEATLPLFGLSSVIKHDPEGFKEYRRWIKRTGSSWNEDYEMTHWGCTRVQIGSIIVQLLGFGIQRANALLTGLNPSSGLAEEESISQDIRMAELWRTAVCNTGRAPEIALSAKYYPNDTALKKVLAKLSEIRLDATTSGWLLKTKEDLPAGSSPSPSQASAES
jgi:hypothetical protein